MKKYHENASEVNSSRKNNLKKKFSLPVIALFLNVVPISLMLLASLHLLTNNYIVLYFSLIVSFIWMATGLGGLFHLTSIILAISYLYKSRKQTKIIGVTLSVISILFPFVLWFILIAFEVVDLQMLP